MSRERKYSEKRTDKSLRHSAFGDSMKALSPTKEIEHEWPERVGNASI